MVTKYVAVLSVSFYDASLFSAEPENARLLIKN